MMMVRLRVYKGDGRPVGELDFPVDRVAVWLQQVGDSESGELHGLRDLVDPMREQQNYDWDIWARPREVSEDLGSGSADPGLIQIG